MTHSPGHIREQFIEVVEALTNGRPIPTELYGDAMLPASTLCGRLWNCSDIIPGDAIFDDLEQMLEWTYRLPVPKRRTFGAYARCVSKLLKVAA
jgi:hypothetical protein